MQTKAIEPPEKKDPPIPQGTTIRLLGTVADLGPERVFILTEGDIKDMLRDMDTQHPGNRGLEAFLRLMEEQMFAPDKEA
jgi:hypothetical protein